MAEPPDQRAVEQLAAELHLPPHVCRLLCIRGFDRADAARLYLRPTLDALHEPALLPGLARASDRLAAAIAAGETILVHGDYDVDGICSVAILVRTLRSLGGKAEYFIPNRMTDGYDLGAAGVNAAIAAGARVVVTCDCGTNALEAVGRLCELGIDVIVTDHHLPSAKLPDCFAVINPRAAGGDYPDVDLCAAGVAFKLALGVSRAMRGNDNRVWHLLDFVALATVADVVPLRGENRVMVQRGLRLLAETRNPGLRALLKSSGLDGRALNVGKIGFILAPRLNAVGRLGSAMRGVELMLTEDEAVANVIARELEELNVRRQEMDRETLVEALAQIELLELDETFALVLQSEAWHPGVVGIAASRVVEEFGRPALLIAVDGDVGKGSARSVPAFDIHAALAECADLLIRYGGHRAAAGVTVERERIPDLAARLNAVARRDLSPDDLAGRIRIDLELPVDEATEALETLVRYFEPFGVGNPSPLFLSRSVSLTGTPRAIGKDGIRAVIRTAHGPLDAVAWRAQDRLRELAAGPLDIVYRLERDDYMGRSTLQARLVDFAPSGSAPVV